jgi:serine/threonine protein kinase
MSKLDKWISKRLENGANIVSGLNNIKRDMICISDPPQEFSNVKKIGAGSFGAIYIGTFQGEKIIIKEALTEQEMERVEDDEDIPSDHTTYKTAYDINNYLPPSEYSLLVLASELLKSRACPNFIYPYHLSMCGECTITNVHGNHYTGMCDTTFMEPANGSLNTYSDRIITKNAQQSILYQLLIALHALETKYGIFHNDIKQENILILEIPPGGYFHYIINRKNYFVENKGLIPCISDFGVSRSFSPLWTLDGYLGERNALVTGDKTMEPITSNVFISASTKSDLLTIGKPTLMRWKGVSGTRNKLYDMTKRTNIKYSEGFDKEIELDVPIDFLNFSKFPAFEFSNDIIDVIRIFIGGLRTTQPGKHKGFKNLDLQLHNSLKTLDLPRRSILGTLINPDDTFYFVASDMLDKFYKPLLPPNDKTLPMIL